MAQYSQNPFTVDPGNDFSAGLAGLSNTMSNIRQAKMQQAQQEMQQKQMQREQDQYDRAQQRFQEVQSAAQEAFSSQDPDKVAQIAIKYPEVTQMLQQATGLKDDMQKKEASGFLRQLNAAPPGQRDAIYQQRIQTLVDQNRDPSHSIQSYEDYKANPEGEILNTKMLLAGADPVAYNALVEDQQAAAKAQLEKDKAAREENRFNREEAGRNQRASIRNSIIARNGAGGAGKPTAHMQDYNRYQELLKTDPEGAKAFGQASGFISKEGRELAPGVQTRLAKTIDSAVAAENNVGKFTNLAEEIDKSNLSGGYLGGSFTEKMKEITGSQDAITDLRREVNSVKASQATANLPPGSASDSDVKLAMGPFPTDNANKKQLASWLRGLSKLQQINADFHNFKADYISDTGSERGMLQAWKQRGTGGGTAGGAKPAPGQPSAPSVTTQAQFDALPSGAVYMEDGQQYRKP